MNEGSSSWWVTVFAPVILPLLTLLLRYLWNLASVQIWVKKQAYGEVLEKLVDIGIAKAEAVANKHKREGTRGPSAVDKLEVATRFVLEQAGMMRMPADILKPEFIQAFIEKNLLTQKEKKDESNS